MRCIRSKDDTRDAAALLRRAGIKVKRKGLQRWKLGEQVVTSRQLVTIAREQINAAAEVSI